MAKARARRRTESRDGISPRNGRGGMALVLALVFVALLTVLIVGFMYEMQVSASLAENQGADFQALLAAKSAVANGISLLADDQIETQMNGEPEYDSTLDPSQWAMGLPFEPINDAMMRTTMADEYGKINLNALIQPNPSGGAPQRNEALILALHSFFALRCQTVNDKDPVDAILDWLDYDDMDAEEPDGAEDSYYMSLENPYACKNGPMDSIEELLLIKGITPALYFGDTEQNQLPLSEYLTVHGDPNGAVNVNTAPVEVLAAVLGAQSGNADMAQAQQMYDQARTQPYQDLSSVSGMVNPGAGAAAGTGLGAGTGTGTGLGGANTKPPAGGMMGRPGSFMQKSMEDPEKQLGNRPGSMFSGSKPGLGQPALPGATKPPGVTKPGLPRPGITAPGTPLDLQQQQRQQQLSQMKQLFRVNSNCFRIYGDGMLEDALVRIEAYVWRTPLDTSTLENGTSGAAGGAAGIPPAGISTKPGGATGTGIGGLGGAGGLGGIGGLGGKPRTGGLMKATTGASSGLSGMQTGGQQTTGGLQTGGNTASGGLMPPGAAGNGSRQAMADAYGAPLVPEEPFRILDWKVIR